MIKAAASSIDAMPSSSIGARLFGAALGSAVMLGAITTLLVHGEYAHAGLPAGVLALLILVGWLALRAWAAVPA